jgi:hypothetical protein
MEAYFLCASHWKLHFLLAILDKDTVSKSLSNFASVVILNLLFISELKSVGSQTS